MYSCLSALKLRSRHPALCPDANRCSAVCRQGHAAPGQRCTDNRSQGRYRCPVAHAQHCVIPSSPPNHACPYQSPYSSAQSDPHELWFALLSPLIFTALSIKRLFNARHSRWSALHASCNVSAAASTRLCISHISSKTSISFVIPISHPTACAHRDTCWLCKPEDPCLAHAGAGLPCATMQPSDHASGTTSNFPTRFWGTQYLPACTPRTRPATHNACLCPSSHTTFPTSNVQRGAPSPAPRPAQPPRATQTYRCSYTFRKRTQRCKDRTHSRNSLVPCLDEHICSMLPHF